MSLAASFAPQIAAIMDVLAKAAVAEVTKLLEDGGALLRLEMSRKDGEILELRRSLTLMEEQLGDAQEEAAAAAAAAARRAAEEEEEEAEEEEERRRHAAGARRVLRAGGGVAPQPCALQPPGLGPEDSPLPVKHEPDDELAAQETAGAGAIASDVFFQGGERGDPTLAWPPPACCMFEDGPAGPPPPPPPFPHGAERYAAHGDGEGPSGEPSPTAANDLVACDPSGAEIKVEVDVRPTCMRSAVGDEGIGHASRDHRWSLAPPPARRPALAAEEPLPNRNSPRARKAPSSWRTNPKPLVCSVCHRGFARAAQLEEHKAAAHRPLKPFRCLECGKSFTQKTRLKTHQSVHTGERPFSCRICGKMFSRQDNCLRHERFHGGLKPYGCGQCGKSFTVLGNLKIHQEIHLKGR